MTPMECRPRVAIALHDRAECAVVADWLTAKGFDPLPRSGVRSAADVIDAQAPDLLITDARSAVPDGLRQAERARNTRPHVILVGDATEEGHAINGEVMYLTRPLDKATLMCFVLMAILENRPEQRSMRKPVSIDAYVNGLPVRIVDVSNEGLCLVTPPDRSLLPLSFGVRVPPVGSSVAVQRIWGRRSKSGTSDTWYGCALAQNPSAAQQGWRAFVGTIPGVIRTRWNQPGH